MRVSRPPNTSSLVALSRTTRRRRMSMTGEIHQGEHPFLAPEADRDPVRRTRGRLVAPVTIVTAGDEAGTAGLTVSSLMLAEGDPGSVHFLLGPTTDVAEIVGRTGCLLYTSPSPRDRTRSRM